MVDCTDGDARLELDLQGARIDRHAGGLDELAARMDRIRKDLDEGLDHLDREVDQTVQDGDVVLRERVAVLRQQVEARLDGADAARTDLAIRVARLERNPDAAVLEALPGILNGTATVEEVLADWREELGGR